MDLKKILGNIGCAALGTIAPPFGGMASNLIKEALGLDKGANDQQIEKALQNATPEQVIALKEAENQFKLDMEKLDVDILKIDQEDRKSARDMQVQTKSKIPAVLSIFVTVGFFGALFLLLSGQVTVADKDVLLVMLGSLGTAWTGIIAYWFGSSNGSKSKDETLHKITVK